MSPWYIWENDNYHIIYNLGFLIPSFVTGNRERQKLSLGVWGRTEPATLIASSLQSPKMYLKIKCVAFLYINRHTHIYHTHTHTIHPSQTHTPLCRHFFSTYHTYLIHTPYILLCSLFHDLYPLQSPSLHGLASFVFIFTCIGRFWNRLQMWKLRKKEEATSMPMNT